MNTVYLDKNSWCTRHSNCNAYVTLKPTYTVVREKRGIGLALEKDKYEAEGNSLQNYSEYYSFQVQ